MRIEADVVQNPYQMGYISLITAYEEISGKTHDRFIDTGAVIVTKDNIDKY